MNFNFLGNIKTKIAGIVSNKSNSDQQGENYDNINCEDLVHMLTVFKDENKILKEKLTIMDKENKLLKNSILEKTDENSSQFGKIFSNLKTTFFLLLRRIHQ